MRRTTKIFIGFLILLFSITLIVILYFRLNVEKYPSPNNRLGEELVFVEIPSADFIDVNYSGSRGKGISLYGDVILYQDTLGSNEIKINRGLSPYLKTTVKGDTLKVYFDFDKMFEEQENLSYIALMDAKIYLPVKSSYHLAVHKNLDIHANHLVMDELDITIGGGDLNLMNNKIRTLTTAKKGYRGGRYISKNNEIDIFNLYLANIISQDLRTSKCKINILNVYGGGYYNTHSVPYTDVNELNWFPCEEDETLNLVLKDSISLKLPK